MMGQAGQPKYDQHGKEMILEHEPKKRFYKRFLYEPFVVESSLKDHLHNHINADITLLIIEHAHDSTKIPSRFGQDIWKKPDNNLKQIYKIYKQSLKMYITSRVLSALRENEGEAMVRDFVRLWGMHREKVPCLKMMFSYLEHKTLKKAQIKCSMLEVVDMDFRKFVFNEMLINVRDVVITLIHEGHEEAEIDHTLLNDVLSIFV